MAAAGIHLGISEERKQNKMFVKLILYLAGTDFWHDFSHKDNNLFNRLAASYCITSGKSVVEYQQELLKLKQPNIGKSIYQMYETTPSNILLFGNIAKDNKFASEEAALNSILPNELRYDIIRNHCFKQNGNNTFGIINYAIGDIGAPYSLTATPVKVRGDFKNISASFDAISTPNVKNYILMIDASHLSMTRLRLIAGAAAPTVPPTKHRFFIIQNIENDSDPATKIGKFDGKKDESDIDKNIEIFFLFDNDGYVTNYTKWDTSTGIMSTLFAGCNLSTTRDINGKINATITLPDNQILSIPDVGKSSEINEAAFLALTKRIEIGRDDDHVFAYFLLKRAGDWCQALSLLDRGRIYTIYDIDRNKIAPFDGNPNTEFPLHILINILNTIYGGVEVALLTHDKILLTYALLQGLNVYFTIKVASAAIPAAAAAAPAAAPAAPAPAAPAAVGAPIGADEEQSSTSITWLLYFKNLLDRDEKILNSEFDKKMSEFTIYIKSVGGSAKFAASIHTKYNTVKDKINAILQTIKKNFVEYIIKLRLIFNTLNQLGDVPDKNIDYANINILFNSAQGAAASPTRYTFLSNISTAKSLCEQYIIIDDKINKIIEDLDKINAIIIPDIPIPPPIVPLPVAGIPIDFVNEYNQIANVIIRIKNGFILRDKNNKPTSDAYQYYINKTLVGLKHDINLFKRNFDIDPTIPLYIHPELNAIIEEKRYKIPIINNFYNELLGNLNIKLAGGGKTFVGGATAFDVNILNPLLNNSIKINVRKETSPLNRLRDIPIISGIIEKIFTDITLHIPEGLNAIIQQFKEYSKEQATNIYNETAVKKIIFYPNIIEYIQDIYVLAINNYIIDPVLFEIYDEPKKLFHTYYVINAQENLKNIYSNDNGIDIGAKIVIDNDYTYTILDNYLITTNMLPFFYLYLTLQQKVDNADTAAQIANAEVPFKSENPYSQIIIKYNFYNLILDIIENRMKFVTKTINDTDPTNKSYYSSDEEKYIQKIYSIVSNIANSYVDISSFLNIFDDESDINIYNADPDPDAKYISEEELTNLIALKRISVIYNYYNKIGKPLNPYQLTRLIYLTCINTQVIEYVRAKSTTDIFKKPFGYAILLKKMYNGELSHLEINTIRTTPEITSFIQIYIYIYDKILLKDTFNSIVLPEQKINGGAKSYKKTHNYRKKHRHNNRKKSRRRNTRLFKTRRNLK